MALLKKIYLPLACLLISLGAVFSATNVSASTVVLSSTGNNDAKFISSSDSSVDMLVPSIAKTDSTGSISNSYTKLTTFSVNRPLKIINASDTHGTTNSKTAKLIIIDATSVDLRSNIEIVGETADLLILGGKSGSNLMCVSCSFTNIGRLTLASATPSFDSLYSPSILSPMTSNLVVGGLSTDRVASVELIGLKITLNGLINTQTRGSLLSDGSYQFNPNGGLIIGAGGVNIFSGFNIDYATLKLGLPISGSYLSLSSTVQINSQAVHISTALPFTMGGIISTKSDVASAVNYRGNLSAVEESIKIYSFSSSGSLIMNGAMYSDNLVDVRSSSDLIFNGNIQAAGLIGVASGKLLQNAAGVMSLPGGAARWVVTKSKPEDDYIVSNSSCATDQPTDTTKAAVCLSAFFSANKVENNGTIKGKSIVMASTYELQNRYGGKIFADNIQLSSQYDFIRNGSKYPFKPANDLPKIFDPIDPSKIPLGTITIDGAPFLAAEEGASRVDSTALILGKNIKIVASGNVENVNPYVEVTTNPSAWNNGVVFSPLKSARVQILAENNLSVGTGSYLLNSSAYMGVSNQGGQFYVSAPSIANQRYTTQAAITEFSDTANAVTNAGIKSALMVYSPPGVIYSFSPLTFIINASGSFVNNTSYFEVLSDANFNNVDASRIINIGLNVQSVVNTSVNSNYVYCMSQIKTSGSGSSEAEGRRIYDEQQKCNKLYGGTTLAPGTKVEAEQGTLFSVKGNVNAENADLFVTNHNVMTEMKNQVISEYILAHSGANAQSGYYAGSIPTNSTTGGSFNYDWRNNMRLSADGNYFVTERIVTRSSCTSTQTDCLQSFKQGNAVSGYTTTEKVVDVLKRIFDQMKAFLIECINKLAQFL
jgi:hypothetical protein